MYTNEKASQLPPRRKKWGPLSQFVSVTIILRIGRVLSGSVLPVHLTHLASALCYNGHRGVLSDPNILLVDQKRSQATSNKGKIQLKSETDKFSKISNLKKKGSESWSLSGKIVRRNEIVRTQRFYFIGIRYLLYGNRFKPLSFG